MISMSPCLTDTYDVRLQISCQTLELVQFINDTTSITIENPVCVYLGFLVEAVRGKNLQMWLTNEFLLGIIICGPSFDFPGWATLGHA